MSWWWIVLIPLACLWALPMRGARADHMPWFFFVAIAALWMAALLFARPLYDFGTNLLRKLGLNRLADFRDRLKSRVLPPLRVALLIMALSSLYFAIP